MPDPTPISLTGPRLALRCPSCDHMLLGDRKLLRDFQRTVRHCIACGADLTQVREYERVNLG